MQMAPMARTAATDPTEALHDTLDHAAALRWQAVLDYRDAMQDRGESVVFAPFGGQVDGFIRRLSTPVGAELVVLGRDSAAGRLWDAVPGDGVPARFGDSVLHGDGSALDVWQVCGRYRRIASAAHPDNPAEPVHVLHRLEDAGR
jgi:hypothetical protein